MILATDLDHTLLPNGNDAYDGTLSLLFEQIDKHDLTLIYASGRNLPLFEEARRRFDIEIPDFFIGSVGTEVFVKKDDSLVPLEHWMLYVREHTPNWDIVMMKQRIGAPGTLRLQEPAVQNEFKLSYYLDDMNEEKEIMGHIKKVITDKNIDADVIYSIDPVKNTGLIDILPKVATKSAALEFLCKRLGVSMDNVVYAGDSGNDILPLTNGYKSILVRNASPNTKKAVMEINEQKGTSDMLYIAVGEGKYNGNYSSGILEGLAHFGII